MHRLNRILQRAFYKLGDTVASHPNLFIIISVFVSIALGTGLLSATYEDDPEVLYTLSNGDFVDEKKLLTQYFPENDTGSFDPSRLINIQGWVRIIVTTPHEDNLLTKNAWEEINELSNTVQSISINYKNESYNYSRICAEIKPGECHENEYVDLVEIMSEIEDGTIRLSYPVMFNPKTYFSHLLAPVFGGVEFKNDNYSLSSLKAIQLLYFLKTTSEGDTERLGLWCEEFIKTLEDNDKNWKYIKVYKHSVYSLIQEQEKNILSVLPHFTITIILMCVFMVTSSLSRDMVRAKPWVALSGIFGAVLGCLGACGLLAYFGVTIIGINVAVPFIMLGIGIDDSFVMLSAWRQTNRLDPVNKRLAKCYSEAAVSITITSVTDMLSFYVGLLTPIQSIQLFCAYAGTSIIGIYLMQLFFFGAFLGISGRQEAVNKHSFFWWVQATPRSKSDNKSTLYKWFLTGGVDKSDPENEKDNTDNTVMVFFRDRFSYFITKTWVKVVVLLIFFVYIGVSIYGIFHIKEGLQEEKLVRDDSYLYPFVEMDLKYLRQYSHRVQVVITTPLDYSNKTIQNQVQSAIKKLCTSSEFVTEQYQENWLKEYLDYIERYSELYEYNITTEANFIKTLREEYLESSPQYRKDIVFNEDFSKIIATRYVIQTLNMSNTENQMQLTLKLREVAKAETNFKIDVFHAFFSFVDQFLAVRNLTTLLVSVAAAIVMLIAVIFIPNFICALFVFFTIFSIELGTLGFMSLWNVNLDLISVINLLMCIGFSCDFPAHVSYSYVTSSGTPFERLQNTLYSLGLPIVQGSVSTLLGVALLVFVPSYIFQVFFKVVFLIIVFSAFHALFLLPVLLQVLKPEKIAEYICHKKTFTINDVDQTSTSTVNTTA